MIDKQNILQNIIQYHRQKLKIKNKIIKTRAHGSTERKTEEICRYIFTYYII
jgi:hypothetical protein